MEDGQTYLGRSVSCRDQRLRTSLTEGTARFFDRGTEVSRGHSRRVHRGTENRATYSTPKVRTVPPSSDEGEWLWPKESASRERTAAEHPTGVGLSGGERGPARPLGTPPALKNQASGNVVRKLTTRPLPGKTLRRQLGNLG